MKILQYWRFKINDIRMWIRYRTTDKYHIVKLDLEPGYYEIDTRILYANFALLSEFVEKELIQWYSCDKIDETEDPLYQEDIKKQNEINKEIYALYDWWKQRENTQEQERNNLGKYPRAPKEWPSCWQFQKQYRDTPEYQAWKNWCDEFHTLETSWNNQDTEKLKQLIDLRRYLWT